MRLPEPRALKLQGPVAVSAAVHLAVILLLIWETGRPPAPAPALVLPGLAGGGRQRVDYLTLSPYRAPAPQDQTRPQPPRPKPSIRVEVQDVARTISVADVVPVTVLPGGLPGGAGAGIVGRAGAGSGVGRGAGTGPGVGGVAGEVFPPQALQTILPPLPKPASVRGMSFRVRFWVDVAGKVTRVGVSPQIPDATYRKQFVQRMYEFSFTPARRPDGTPVAGETVLTITL